MNFRLKSLAVAALMSSCLPLVAKVAPLSKQASERLAENGFVILDQPLEEGFVPYLGEDPVFVTSDSLLMAFHRIQEDVHFQREVANIAVEHEFVRGMLANYPVGPRRPDDPVSVAGWQVGRAFLGTAGRLLFSRCAVGFFGEEKAMIEAEAKRIEVAQEFSFPSFLYPKGNPPESAKMSYHIFRPVGPWATSPILSQYYRYQKWLQSTPLLLTDPTHRAMIEHLALAFPFAEEANRKRLISPGSGGALFTPFLFQELPRGDEEVAAWHDRNLKLSHGLNVAYLLPSERFSETGLLNLLASRGELQLVPAAIGAAFQNPLAARELPEPVAKSASSAISFSSPLNAYGSALAALSNATDERAPALCRTEAWSRKQWNTVCGGWADERYNCQQGNRKSVLMIGNFGGAQAKTGFVEPVPSFFRKIGQLAEKLALAMQGVEKRDDLAIAAHNALWLESKGALMARFEANPEGKEFRQLWKKEELARMELMAPNLSNRVLTLAEESPTSLQDSAENRKEFREAVNLMVLGFQQGDTSSEQYLRKIGRLEERESENRFFRLAALAFRLESIAERQLAGRELAPEDHQLLNEYGQKIADLMGYGGLAASMTSDTAPRIASYFSVQPGPELAPIIHHAATARPRLLVIQYPDGQGGQVTSVGSVYAFRVHRDDRTPSNEEWLEESRTSEWLDWITPVVAAP